METRGEGVDACPFLGRALFRLPAAEALAAGWILPMQGLGSQLFREVGRLGPEVQGSGRSGGATLRADSELPNAVLSRLEGAQDLISGSILLHLQGFFGEESR